MTFKFNLTIMLTLFIIFVSFTVVADNLEQIEFVDPDVPESWYQEPKLASEVGITEFDQSPMLDKKVANGELPPVEERLPEDPPVIEPYEQIGRYGGTAVVWSTSLGGFSNKEYLTYSPTFGHPTPDGNEMIPHMIKGWKYSNNFKTLTLYLREGIKWSDGHLYTADDIVYWWKYEANNKDINPVPPQEWKPIPIESVNKVDDWTVTVDFGKPHPRIHEFYFQHCMSPGQSGIAGPAHFLKQFHPDFIGKEKAVQLAKDVDLDRWDEYYGRMKGSSLMHPEYEYMSPSLRSYIAVERTETYLILERNPYFPFVDTAGNQLPYIDRIRVNLANNPEMAVMKATTGEATFAARYTANSQIPLYKRNENQGNYTTYLYRKESAAEVALKPNLTHEDPKIREIFQDLRFRKALSYAINRDQINQKIYYGRAVVMQSTCSPLNDLFEESFANAFVEYNPEKSKELLDEMGMIDINGDGLRERPDGEEFKSTILYCQGDRTEYTPILELVTKFWREVGLNIGMKMVSRSLHDQRFASNNADINNWMFGGGIGIKFGNAFQLGESIAPMPGGYAGLSPWPGWISWYNTDGEEGVEPPDEIKQLVKWGEILGYSPDQEKRYNAGKQLLQAQADNLWTIGTVGVAQRPLIVNNKLKNVPKKGLLVWGMGEIMWAYPMQFYLEE